LVTSKFSSNQQHDSHELFMHLISSLQDECTPRGAKFNGDVSDKNEDRTVEEIVNEYFETNPSIVDKVFMGIKKC
jgi:hypothetical protein